MAADTRQASACHRWLRIEIDWRDDSSYGSNRVALCGILFLLRLVIESECELIELVVIVLEIDIYRLYYTSECEDQQTIDVYFEDNHDQLYQLTFTFNNEVKEEEEEPTTETTLTPIGTIVSPININP